MDSLTQVALGGAVGDAVLGQKAGNKAVLWGTILGTVPDLDVVTFAFLDIVEFTRLHRGFSHSLIFILLGGAVFGSLLHHFHRRLSISRKAWVFFSLWILGTHILLDCFTTWGTQVFWPFQLKVAFQNIFVIDPLYTLPLLLFLIAAMRKQGKARIRMTRLGLLLSSAYMILTLGNKAWMQHTFQQAFDEQEKRILRFQVKPTPLNNLLWTSIAETPKGFLIGYHSLLDNAHPKKFLFYPKQRQHLQSLQQYDKFNKLLETTQGYYLLRQENPGTWLLHDLRFGVMDFDPGTPQKERPVFTYRITPAPGGKLSIKRTEGASTIRKQDLSTFWERIKGIS